MKGVLGLPYSDDQLYNGLYIILPAWALLAAAPRGPYTRAVVTSVCATLAVFYCALVAREFGSGFTVWDWTNLHALSKTFRNKGVVFLGWVHCCVIDLWAAMSVARDASDQGVPRALMAPVLLLFFMFAPAGLLAYLLVRTVIVKQRAMAPAGTEAAVKRD